MKQLGFEKFKAFKEYKKRTEHGGEIRPGKRKLARPFDRSKSMHVVLRAARATKEFSLLRKRNENQVMRIVHQFAKKYQITIHKFANVGNHLHILLKAKSKAQFQNFLRTITGLIARHVTGARKGKSRGKFWDGLTYSKLVSAGVHFKNTLNYVWRNQLEGWGAIPPRSTSKGHERIDYLTLYDW